MFPPEPRHAKQKHQIPWLIAQGAAQHICLGSACKADKLPQHSRMQPAFTQGLENPKVCMNWCELKRKAKEQRKLAK